jgi:hypothetical protein
MHLMAKSNSGVPEYNTNTTQNAHTMAIAMAMTMAKGEASLYFKCDTDNEKMSYNIDPSSDESEVRSPSS